MNKKFAASALLLAGAMLPAVRAASPVPLAVGLCPGELNSFFTQQ